MKHQKGRTYKKLNDPNASIGDRVKYFGIWGHISSFTDPDPSGAYKVIWVRDDGFRSCVTIDPARPISDDSDSMLELKAGKAFKESVFKTGTKKKKKTTTTDQ